MHRNTRLTQIVRILRTEGRLSAEQFAARFRVSPRTVYRDIALLHRMGVPVVGEAGVGYHLDGGAHLEPVEFTADELDAVFRLAQKGLRGADPQQADAIMRVMTKVKQVVPSPMLDALSPPGERRPMERAEAGSKVEAEAG